MPTKDRGRFTLPMNRYPLDDFEGFTPNEMHELIYRPFDNDSSPLIMNTDMDDNLIPDVQFYKFSTRYLEMLRERQPLKLTQKGNLPRKFCRELIDEGIVENDQIALRFRTYPLMREDESRYIFLINHLTQMIGLTKIRSGKISLTHLVDRFKKMKTVSPLFLFLLIGYIDKFNWGYDDYYPESNIIQAGFGFSIFLVQKYGDKERNDKFYARKYLKAFPSVMRDFEDTAYCSGEEKFMRCYFTRVFERFLRRFGLVKILKGAEDLFALDKTVVKTELMDQVFEWKIP